MNEENAIEIKDLVKEYKMYNRKQDQLIEILFPKVNRHQAFRAVNGLNLNVKKGEILGILGKNGAGKSTLLKMVTGVVVPTSGEIHVKGKISSLLELGAAFNSELTGYENIYQHGQVMGMTNEEIKAKEQEIIDFADIGEHLSQPVKTYSSGMFARLAFACAINVEPEVLIVDEVLSVGDMAFQEKSITKMKEIRKKGTTILFVSHSLHAIKNFCTRAIWMRDGQIVLDGDTGFVTDEYKKYMIDNPREKQIQEKIEVIQKEKKKKKNDKNKSIRVEKVTANKEVYDVFDDIYITIELDNLKQIDNYGVGLLITNSKGEITTAINSVRIDQLIGKDDKKVTYKINRNNFAEDTYYVTVSVCDEKIMFSYDKVDYATSFKVKVPRNHFGALHSEGLCSCDYEIIKEG